MPRRRIAEDSLRTDRWVISYADFITLLFAFFVVMYAISSVNVEKYREVANSLSDGFENSQAAQNTLSEESGVKPSGVGVFSGGETDYQTSAVKIVPPDLEKSAALQAIGSQLEVQFKKLIRQGHLAVQSNTLWVTLEMSANLVFPEGGALPAITSDPVFERLAKVLNATNNPIHVEGFTDRQLISTDQFPSNWELSAARAASIVRILEMNGVEPSRMAAVGFGEYQPLLDSNTEAARRVNRRVVIVISRDRKTQRVVSAFGSQQTSEDAVSAILSNDLPESQIKQITTEDGQLSFRRSKSVED